MEKLLYFLRHGQAQSNANGFYAGQMDVPLTEKGMEQAKAVRPLLQNIFFDKLYCSDLQRAKTTASLALPQYTPIYTDRIREISVGELAGLFPAECEEKYGEAYKEAQRSVDYSPFGGENCEMLDKRVFAFLDEITSIPEDKIIGVVCHAGVMKSAARYVLRDLYPGLIVDNCAVCVFGLENGKWRLINWNVTVEL